MSLSRTHRAIAKAIALGVSKANDATHTLSPKEVAVYISDEISAVLAQQVVLFDRAAFERISTGRGRS